MRRFAILFMVFVSVAAIFDGAAETIKEADLKEWLSYLASSECEGRSTGSEGQEKAARMIETVFKDANLSKFNGSYRQVVRTMKRCKLDGKPQMEFNGKSFKYNEDFNPAWLSGGGEVEATVIFCGYGLESKNYNDYENMDVKDKIVLLLPGSPGFIKKKQKRRFLPFLRNINYYIVKRKIDTAVKHGASAVLIASGIEKDSREFRDTFGFSARSGGEVTHPVLLITPKTAKDIIGKDLKELEKKIEEAKKPVSFAVENGKLRILLKIKEVDMTTSNICGYIEGGDPYLKERYIVVGAHYDHLGRRGNRIYYGADDNASGTTAVLAVANAFSTLNSPPKRSVIFVTFTGEEIGFVGSRFFVEHPPVPLENIDAMVNIDMVGRAKGEEKPRVGFSGGSMIRVFEKACKEAAEKANVNAKLTDSPPGPYSDHYPFQKNGIPSIFIHTGLHKDYHKPTDTADKINYKGLTAIAKATFHLTHLLADYDGVIRPWIEGRPAIGIFVAKDKEGVRVMRLLKDGAAAKAGVKEGDILLQVDGKTIEDEEALDKTLRRIEKDRDRIEVRVKRNDEELELSLTVPSKLPESRPILAELFRKRSSRILLGVYLDETEEGLKITEVVTKSNAERIGLKENDIIIEVDDVEVKSRYQLRMIMMRKKRNDKIKIKIKRNGKEQSLEGVLR